MLLERVRQGVDVRFDPTHATVELTVEELKLLLQAVVAADTSLLGADWADAGLVVDHAVVPVVEGMAHVALSGERSIAIERIDGDLLSPVWVAWDRSWRATITEPAVIGDGSVPGFGITATQFELLPGLIRQLVRLHPRLPDPTRPMLSTTAGVIDDLFTGQDTAADDNPSADDLAAVLGAARHSWRASGSWRDHPTDTSMTVLDAGNEGLWLIERPDTTNTPDRSTPVVLQPATTADVTARLGDVVTGRTSPHPGRWDNS